MREIIKPADIERESMAIIARELAARGETPPEETGAVVRRVIHATADFDYAKALCFTDSAVTRGAAALRGGVIVTDTNMARAGVSASALRRLGCAVVCHMADEDVAAEAKARGVTRSVVSMERSLAEHPRAVFAIGNAPTALLSLADAIEAGARPALVIGVPVGFVNVVEAKEELIATAPHYIVARGRKGGSNVAACIVNALLYMLDETRGQ